MGIRINHPKTGDLVENPDINVTPFIDVMLVLLIIFMVAAPLATVDINVNLPSSNAPSVTRPLKPIFLTLKSDHSIFLDDKAVSEPALGAAIEALTGGDKTQPVFIRADKTIAYGDLVQVMNDLRTTGYIKISLVTDDQTRDP